MAIDVAELMSAYAQALNRIRALQGVSTQHLWDQEYSRLERLRLKAARAFAQRDKAMKHIGEADAELAAALKQIEKVRKVKV